MGVRGLYGYINRVPGSFKTVNIIDEARKYENKHGRNPTIVINLWTMANHQKQDVKDVIVGYRLIKLENKFREFLEKLQNAGVEMIFTFKKSEVKDVSFKKNVEIDYCHGLEMIDLMRNTNEVDGLAEQLDRKLKEKRFQFPFNQAAMLVLTQVAQTFGKLIGTDSKNCRPCTSQVQLANQHEAMAIIGLNTHYIFYEGSWEFWSDADLDMDAMTIRQYDKKKILDFMGLTVEQSRLFAILAGSLISDVSVVDHLVNHFGRSPKKVFANVRNFVRGQRFPLNDETLRRIIRNVFRHQNDQIFHDFKRSLRIMDPKTLVEGTCDPIIRIVKDDYANFAEDILEDIPIFLCPNYLDLGEINIHELVIPFIQKTAGILLKSSEPRTVIFKTSLSGNFNVKKVPSTVPDFQIPPLKSLVSGEMSEGEKLKILLWLTGLEEFSENLKKIPFEFIVDVIICLHLFQQKVMRLSEAEAMMQTIVAARNDTVSMSRYPQKINVQAFRLTFLHSKVFFNLSSCLAAIGLKIYQSNYKFDGAHFQRVYAVMCHTSSESSIDLKMAFQKFAEIISKKQND